MPGTRSELEQRRAELTAALPGLSENRAETYRHNSDALARDRAGVKHEGSQEMARLSGAETAADAAIRAAQSELRDIDAEIARLPRSGLATRLQRRLRRARDE